MTDQAIYLIYDGECPLCSTSAKALKIRKAVGTLHLINARENHPIMQEINLANLNIDKGMVVKFNDTLYHGADAQHILAMIGSNNDFFNRINVWLFRSKTRAHLLYPIFRMLRNILLWLNKTPKVNNLDHDIK
jgi:predicted DCC family thiol-disulfide oxidoreductase YuxK